MKKGKTVRMTAICLSAALFLAGIFAHPVNASQTETEQKTETEIETIIVSPDIAETAEETEQPDEQEMEELPETVSEETVSEETVPEETTPEETTPEETTLETLLATDFSTLTDHEADELLIYASTDTICAYLFSISDEEREALLGRDTFLTRPIYGYRFDYAGTDTDGNALYELGEETEQTFYEDAMSSASKLRSVWNESGMLHIAFRKGDVTNTVALTLKVTSAHENDSDYAASVYIKVANSSNGFAISSSKTNQGNNASYPASTYPFRVATSQGGDGKGEYNQLWIPFSFTKPAGYKASYSVNTESLNNTTAYLRLQSNHETNYKNDSTAASTDAVTTAISMYNCVGSVGTPRKGTPVYTISLTPITYHVVYDGNGATSGSVAAQSCVYDKIYTIPGNGYVRSYTMTFAGNGGTPDIATGQISYTFTGWGQNTTSSKTHDAGQTYSNLTTEADGKLTMYAIWKNSVIKLPGATRTGYTFKGWKDGYAQLIGNKGDIFVPSANMTVTAQWDPNSYTVKLDTAGGEILTSLTAEYDKDLALPTPKRSGYTFKGWNGAGGSFAGTVRNLTSVNGGTVTLTADWTPNNDTVYTIRRYVQKYNGADDYELYDTQTGRGTTDTYVSPAPEELEGYVTPPAGEMQKIEGDGSTAFSFYYKRADLADDFPEDESKAEQENGSTTGKSSDMTWIKEQQEQIVKLIEKGSSASYIQDEISYLITKNADDSLTILLKDLHGKTDVVIPDALTIAGKTYPVTEIAGESFCGSDTLKSVTIGNNVSKIGESAFENCKKLTSVTFGKGLLTIGEKAFKGCVELRKIQMPQSLQTIGKEAFSGCVKLQSVKCNTGLLTIGNKAFYNCKSMKKIDITKTVLKIGSYAFAKCVGLKTVTFAADSGLLSLGTGAFAYCSALGKIKIPAKVTALPGKCFYQCKNLARITGGNAVTKIGGSAMYGCKKITSYKIGSRVQTIGAKAFYGCKALRKVTVTSKALTSVGAQAFKKCRKGIRFSVPKSKINSYQKLFRGKY